MPHEAALGGPAQAGRIASSAGRQRPASRTADGSFARSLAEATGGAALRFSAHATDRLASRNIRFTADEMARVEQAADVAARRGSRDALLMMNDLGLIVNIKNRTVLTALDLGAMKDGIVTNIDSTVVVKP